MKLATIRTPVGNRAVVLLGEELVEIGPEDVGALLAAPDWRAQAERANGARHAAATADFATLVPRPDKVICVGLNYRNHIEETGNKVPEYPTLFAKYRGSLIGANDPIAMPAVSKMIDWEVELGVVIGAPVRNASPEQARAAIAGWTVVNDISMRDWQRRTVEFLQGKTFESSTPVGPYLVTDDGGELPTFEISCSVNGAVKQHDNTSDLVFDPVALIAYCSQIITLLPGDVIATGTPGGVGHARKPQEFLAIGDEVVTEVVGVGVCRNRCTDAAAMG